MQNIIITGVTRGLGLELLNYFINKHYNLILISKNKKQLINLKKKFKKNQETMELFT